MTSVHSPTQSQERHLRSFLQGALAGLILLIIGITTGLVVFYKNYEGKIYPNVSIDGIPFGGKTPEDIQTYWLSQNIPFTKALFEFKFEGNIATVSGEELNLGYDATLSATQAYSIGRSGHWFRDIFTTFFRGPISLAPYFRWNTDVIDTVIQELSDRIDIPAQDALFTFQNGRVTAFRLSHNGRRLNSKISLQHFNAAVAALPHALTYHIIINLPVEETLPEITTENINSFGIKEHIASGYSEFHGSIPGRIHNVALAASRLNGVLIAPGETFSFNKTIGDISAATGYQSAYIIKDGRTMLGDGGGVCQVSTTLFRAALNAGLPIVERHAHAYRVHYYEEAGYKAGLDATVFSPSVDLRFTNDTPSHILIQTKIDITNMTLLFDLYGTKDGRDVHIYNHVVYGQTPPPAALYQDDPTLAPGQVKQVDWAAWGAKASFAYKVTRGNEILQNTTFYSNFRPWQAVYLQGPHIQ